MDETNCQIENLKNVDWREYQIHWIEPLIVKMWCFSLLKLQFQQIEIHAIFSSRMHLYPAIIIILSQQQQQLYMFKMKKMLTKKWAIYLINLIAFNNYWIDSFISYNIIWICVWMLIMFGHYNNIYWSKNINSSCVQCCGMWIERLAN